MRKRIITFIALAFAVFGLLGSTAASASETGSEPAGVSSLTELKSGQVGTLASEEIDYAVEHALTDPTKYCAGNGYVSGCVQPYGDVLWIKDNASNGAHVTLKWEDLDGDRYGKCRNTLGADAGWARCNKDLPENHRIAWQLAYKVSSGSDWSYSPVYETRV
ncbi:hypothetical protein [Phytomonospora endophytica]|uniref:Uncharacterized protein n=1 Tax=Phytomonospora endophytica TaxID=714109 RepID=A0A841FSU7_9ACTN|nr:hypothetical protein [Phytomonospora endophytica]MBB6037883.1 hypothetical protein [Phytomonospora endophytica]GIG68782.1 hypothetical protein Pen01_50770 [Phytomonospora endophytica]